MAEDPSYTQADSERVLAMVRSACQKLPEVSERLSHGGPAFFVREKKTMAMFVDDHHDDTRLAIWCAAPEGVQAEMLETEPDRFFYPPYVGHRGWLGVHLLQFEQDEVNAIVLDAYRCVAPTKLIALLDEPAAD